MARGYARSAGAFASILVVLAGLPNLATGQAPETPVLDIPDSLVIQGRVQHELLLAGTKSNTLYDRAFPVEREDVPEQLASVNTLPAISSKETFPLFIRHGSVHATALRAAAQHFGNGSLWVGRWQDWKGFLLSSDLELGGGRGHTDNASWWRTALGTNARYMPSWRTACDGSLDIESGRTAIWDGVLSSHRNYSRGGLGLALNRGLSPDQEVSLFVEGDARRVSGPEATANEKTLASVISWQNTTGRFWIKGNVQADFTNTARPAGTDGTGSFYAVSAEAWTRPEENFGGAVGVTIYTVNYLSGDSLRTIRPSIAAWGRVRNLVKFTGRLSSGVQRFGIWEAYQANQMLNLATPLRSPFTSVDIDLNVETSVHRDNVLTFGFRQLIVDDYAVWVRKDSTVTWRRRFPTEPHTVNQFGVDYGYAGTDQASLTSFYARYQYAWREGSVDALGLIRAHSLVQQPVPYVPDWEFHLGARFPFRRFTVAPSLHTIGTRHYIEPKTLDQIAEMDPYVLVDLEVSTALNRHWQLALLGSNLLNSRYQRWNGFNEPGIYGQIGIRRTW